MPLAKVPFAAGFNKQITATQAQNVWIDGDNVRFRYGMPEKIGGWNQLNANDLVGVARQMHNWFDLDGRRYSAIGTNRILAIYYDEIFYDITPLDSVRTQANCDITTTNGSNIVTITTPANHNLQITELVAFSAATGLSGTSFTSANFTDNLFEVLTVPSPTTFTIQMPSNESTGSVTNNGSLTITPYIDIGNYIQQPAYGFGTGTWGLSTWGTSRTSSNLILDPGLWSLDNYGQTLIATVHNGPSFSWNPVAADTNALATRAVALSGNPTKSVATIVSDRDRHLVHLGTETTIGTTSTQDKMFIRFSDQEDLNTYAPTSTNTAGTFRLDSGSEIIAAVKGKDYIFILTDTAAYIMQFVGPPFTFSIKQVGTNCGCLGPNAAVYVNGAVYWISDEGGFFVFDGTVKALPCLVEDFVFTSNGNNLGLNFSAGKITFASHNSLFSEINWFYPKAGSNNIDRVVTYNYDENVWTVGTLARTTYFDQGVFPLPYATRFYTTGTGTFPTVQGITNQGASRLYEHESGLNEVDANGTTTAIQAFIQSGDFELDVEGNGEYFIKIRRFIPDFGILSGQAKVTLNLRAFPNDTQASSPLGPFTVTPTTKQIHTRARSRLASVKIENDAVDQNWRLGLFRFDIQPDGRR